MKKNKKKDIVLEDRPPPRLDSIQSARKKQRTNRSSTVLNDASGLKLKGYSVFDVNGCKGKIQAADHI